MAVMIEIILVIVGVIFMIGSFFITEKLSQKEISQISDLSTTEIKYILDKNMNDTEKKIVDMVDGVIEQSMEVVGRALDKETNTKIQEISEYAETVVESIQKNHNEVVFLYSMLNDKQVELTGTASRLEQLKKDLLRLEKEVDLSIQESSETVRKINQKVEVPFVEEMIPQNVQQMMFSMEESETELSNKNQDILDLYRQGKSIVEIAKQLGLGVGEVKLVLELYKEV